MTEKNKKGTFHLSSLLASAVCFALLYVISLLALQGSGYFPQPNWQQIALFMSFIIIFSSSQKYFYFIALPILFIYACYAPIGVNFGAPSYQYIASVFATDLQEGKEFFAQIPPLHYSYPFVILSGALLYRKLSQKFHLVFYKNKGLLALIFINAFWGQIPFQPLQESYLAGEKVIEELRLLNRFNVPSEWGESQLDSRSHYDDYILVIGESARKDYHHAYGYPIANTPFLSTAKGTLINGLTAGGTNTIASLKLMFTKPNKKTWEGNYRLNFIDLIKSAGLKTYWLSNQGYLGQYDTPISAIANKSDEKLFLKSGDSLSSDVSDFKLIAKFDQLLQKPSENKRFIVIHLYGSHPLACERVADYKKIFDDTKIDKKYQEVNCYISSIKKTDEILSKIYQLLVENQQKNHRTFSMIYFADHGLAHQISDNYIAIHNSNGKSKRHYDIPLFKISSDDQQRHEKNVAKSGLNFTEGLANWIGIRNANIDANMDLFDETPQPDYGLKEKIENITAPDDPAVIIPAHR
ncbi:phosphoethanolamine transferase [Avibacterium sp. 20-126]|uniref:phosphoethanolamine transferase n=1 Tax=Avibacterium sp. 20-126 TaxID=2911524 RepID=UPI00218AC71E|nr:phosphoethanolamine transferase [Avibacterium sp. 20-126]